MGRPRASASLSPDKRRDPPARRMAFEVHEPDLSSAPQLMAAGGMRPVQSGGESTVQEAKGGTGTGVRSDRQTTSSPRGSGSRRVSSRPKVIQAEADPVPL